MDKSIPGVQLLQEDYNTAKFNYATFGPLLGLDKIDNK